MMRSAPLRLVMLSLALLLAAGCGGSKGGGASHSIVVWVQMDPNERARFEENIAAYKANHPGLDITYVPYQTEDLRTNFQTAAAAGGGPQLIFGPSDQVGPLSLLKLIRPLDTTMPPGFFDRFVPQALDSLDGHLYAVPDQVGNHLVMCFNRKLVNAPPQTSAEFLALAKHATRRGTKGQGEVYGFVMETTEPFWLVPFLAGFGGWVMDDQHRPTLDTPAMVQALTYLQDLKNREGVMPRESNYANAHTLFSEGQAAMIINGPWSWSDYRKKGIDLGIAPIFRLPNGQWAKPMTASKGYSINTNAKDAELPQLLEFLDYLSSPEAELRGATTLGILPSNRIAYADSSITNDPIMQASKVAYELGRRMPVVPEMRVIWDVMRPGMQQVMNGSKAPAAAAKDMQAAAIQQLAGMKQ